MLKNNNKEVASPSWTEVILGAVLALGLGVVIGVGFLIAKPVVTAKELPKDAGKDTVYFLEGSKDTAKGRQGAAKLKLFAQTGTASVTEDELNALVAPTTATAPAAPAKPAKPGEKPVAAAAPLPDGLLTPGAPNFRIRDGVLQIGVPVRVSALGLLDVTIMAQARGTIVKQGGGFGFEPTTLLVGSLPMHRLPAVQGLAMGKFFRAQKIPDDVAAGWAKLGGAMIEGSTLKLAAQ